MASNWDIDFTDVDNLIKKVEQIPNRSEKVINETLKIKGSPLAMQKIQEGIPVSTWKGRVLNKKHARDSKALNVKHGNLEFTIRPKKQFEYIKYPDLGIGTSKRNPPKEFMRGGLEKARQPIINDLTSAVENEINKTLGG
ncbi:HK97-gp10 family putative phage morphogenesis protein [Heyndrickxia coagulans]|uniref:HK97-gp10 family putative phage morphogenesis protein n=1 Tax=Heyndrickxia coagulans TaxID=1398 RepID=UPI0014526A6E|nr:HK97-gp10 family putative phage morphogenesis protein [Heyndrickxia coagulans]MED4492829.1 hypothetical protein [Heyndrickxia coagulans]MED4535008.1 hypothetical protein [Heyndrickxia coagulans]QJE31805.1 hypothetical protein HHU11_03555 [Heyndrickxia coagulans]